MSGKYSAKEYLDAISGEVDEAAKAVLQSARSIIETAQNTLADSSESTEQEGRLYILVNGMSQLVSFAVSMELAVNNIERLINIINITASLSGLDEREAGIIDRGGYSLFNYYTPFVDDSYLILDYYEKTVDPEKTQDDHVRILTVFFDNIKTMCENLLKNYGSIVERRKGREK